MKIKFKVYNSNNPKTILFIHGWSHSSAVWDKIIEDISRKYRTITLDLPGHGESEAFFKEKDNLTDQITKSVYNFIQENKIKPYAIISHSMGGLITLKLLKEYGVKTQRLMIIGTPYCGLPKWISIVGKQHKITFNALKHKNKLPTKAKRFLSKWGSKITVKDLNNIHENLYKAIESANPEYLAILFKELSTNCFKLDKPLNIEKSIVARGEYDLLVSRETMIKLARYLNAEYYQFKNVSHTVPIEAPEELKELIFKLLD